MPVNRSTHKLLRSPQDIVFPCKVNRALAALVDARADELGVTKQDVIRGALISHLEGSIGENSEKASVVVKEGILMS